MKWTQMNSNYDTFSNDFCHHHSTIFPCIFTFHILFTCHSEWWHWWIVPSRYRTAEKKVNEELKEIEWVCHKLEKAKKEIIHKIQQFKRKCMEIQEELSQYKSGSRQHVVKGKLYLIHILIIKHIQLVHITYVCLIINWKQAELWY